MDFIFIPLVAAGASLLTFFSGFGLGTLLTPVFAIFFPIDLSIALTAIVHFLNNLFKLTLVGKYARQDVLFKFGLTAIIAALLGAWILSQVADLPPLFTYEIGDKYFHVLPVKLVIAILIVAFTLFELHPKFKSLEVDKRFLPLGGLVSGFFGGLSGHQGALRSAFLARAGLTKEQFIGTGTVIACLIDGARISLYSTQFKSSEILNNWPLLTITIGAAFLGAYLGNRLLKKVTMTGIQNTISILLFILALGLGMGII